VTISDRGDPSLRSAKETYDDGGFSGGSMERPALQKLLGDVRARKIDVIVVCKVDRLTRSLSDFAKLVELFDAHGVCFISVTQAFNTTTSMGRLTLNMLLSFTQFEGFVTPTVANVSFVGKMADGDLVRSPPIPA
jgi:DNA invertase Pin-like site-specific DNA recombinase